MADVSDHIPSTFVNESFNHKLYEIKVSFWQPKDNEMENKKTQTLNFTDETIKAIGDGIIENLLNPQITGGFLFYDWK